MLTRLDFNHACEALVNKYTSITLDSPETAHFKHWEWKQHPVGLIHVVSICSI
jgi:hypothetical protein